ncbi:MAG TPA: sulfotransferase [Acidimicrobiales bacterium]|nr:sulfotransferase [Acidimicrobiales bacterium]
MTVSAPRPAGADGAPGGASRPNVFIVGAPKAGTTALAQFLGSHPDVFVADKELSFFGADLDFRTRRGAPWRITWEAYAAWFAGHEAERCRVDRSVFYLWSQHAAEEIHAFDPSSRIIVLVRNPVDQMHSEHSEMLFQGEEDIADFATALAAEPDRLQGRRIPAACQHVMGLYYRDLARYAGQIERYLHVFGPAQVHVVVHDDLRADAAGTYRGVLEFLGVDRSHTPAFEEVNANKQVRSVALRRTLRSGSPGLRRAARLVVRGAGARARVRRALHDLNTSSRPRAAIDPGLRAILTQEFEPEVRRLESLLGRELPAWHVPESTS